MAVKSIPAGTGSGLSDNAKSYMQERDQYWGDKAKAIELLNAGIKRAKK